MYSVHFQKSKILIFSTYTEMFDLGNLEFLALVLLLCQFIKCAFKVLTLFQILQIVKDSGDTISVVEFHYFKLLSQLQC